jgi:Flp pilus assembly protein TadB
VNQSLRIGDAEREEAARELGEHYALGRISTEEHSDRLERIWAARTSADLTPVFSDLPRPQPERPAPTMSERVRSFAPLASVPFALRLLCFVVLFVLAVTHLPIVLLALLVYVLVVRRAALRRRGPWHGYGPGRGHWR